MSGGIGVRGGGEGFPSVFNLQPRAVPVRGSERVVPTTPRGIPPLPGGASDSPVTDALTRARFVKTTVSNPNQIVGNTTDKTGWVSITIDRPSILWSVTAHLDGPILYGPDRQPARDIDALSSGGHGVAYFSGPGVWWFKYDAGDGTRSSTTGAVLDFLIHDAADPAVASKFLGEPGSHGCTHTQATVASDLVATPCLFPNVRRKAVILQTLIPTAVCRIGLGLELPLLVGVNSGLGLRLGGTAGNSITLSGDTLIKGRIWGILEPGGPSTNLSIVEFW